jgi:hypothetical protein
MCGCVKSLNPIGRRHTSLKQHGASSIIDGADHALSFTVLRRSVWAGQAQVYAIGEEEGARAGVIQLTPIVALDSFHRDAKLRAHIGKEVCQCGECVRFNTKRESPQIMRTVIKNK